MGNERFQTERELARLPVFAAIDRGSRAVLAEVATVRSVVRGAVVWSAGEAPDELGILLAGRIDIERVGPAGERILLRTLTPPAAIGLSVVAGHAHSADVVAGEDSRLAIVPGASIRDLFSRRPESALRALAWMGELLGRLTDEVETSRSEDLTGRVRAALLRCVEPDGVVRLTHEELGAIVGASRSNVSRALKRLERDGEIRLGRGRIVAGAAPRPTPPNRGGASYTR